MSFIRDFFYVQLEEMLWNMVMISNGMEYYQNVKKIVINDLKRHRKPLFFIIIHIFLKKLSLRYCFRPFAVFSTVQLVELNGG